MTTAPKRAKFTKSYVDRVRPAAKDDFHWDTDVKGFGLRITPTGKITFVVQGRVEGSGKEARITIGAYGVFTVDQARDVAREHLRTMRKGGDPRANKRQDEAMKVTLRQVADAYFDRPGQPLRDSTKAEMNRHIDKVFAKWADSRCVVGFFGRGSTAKSSFVATMGAEISGEVSTLWISVEEPADWIKVRHMKAGGNEAL